MILVKKLQAILFLTLIFLGLFVSGLASSNTPVNAQACITEPSFADLKVGVESCAFDSEGSDLYSGYSKYKSCLEDCVIQIADDGGSKQDMVNCATKCSQEKNFDKAYLTCVSEYFNDASPTLRQCLCNNNQDWLDIYPHTCKSILPKPSINDKTTDYLGSFLPNCSISAPASQDGLIACLRSVIDLFFFIGIGIFFIRVSYLAVNSAFSFNSNFWAEVKKALEGLIIGILFVGMPTVIMSLINPTTTILSLKNFAEFNMNADLIDPFNINKKAVCGDEPKGSSGEIVYDLLLDSPDDIKYPSIVMYDCKLHIATVGEDSYKHWTMPIFDSTQMVETTPFARKGNQRIDYVAPSLASGPNGVAIAIAEQDGFYSKKWMDTAWGAENKNAGIPDLPDPINGGIAATSSGWAGVAVRNYTTFLSGPLSADLSGSSTFEKFTPDVSNDMSYGRRSSLANKDDGSVSIIGVSGGEGMFVYTFNGTIFTDMSTITPKITEGCYGADVDIDEDGKIYYTCYIPGGSIMVYEGSGSSWNSEKIGTGAFKMPSISIDEEGGAHLVFTTDSATSILYYYKAKDGAWEEQGEVTIGMAFNSQAVGYAGKQPFVAFVVEDWSDGGPRAHLYLMAGKS